MRATHRILILCAVGLVPGLTLAVLGRPVPRFVYETPAEFLGSGDFNGDGRLDLVIVDRASGKYRLGLQTESGWFSWLDNRPSGLKDLSGISIGRLVSPQHDSIALAAVDLNQVVVVRANPAMPEQPIAVPFEALGPNAVAAVDIGGEGNTPLDDLAVGSIYNSPEENLATLFRNRDAQFTKLAELTLPGPATRPNRVALRPGEPERLCFILGGTEAGEVLRLENLGRGQPEVVAMSKGLPPGAQYLVGNFGGQPLRDFLVYKPGEADLVYQPLTASGAGAIQFGEAQSFALPKPAQLLVTLGDMNGARFLAFLGAGEEAAVFQFDGASTPRLVQTIPAPANEIWTGGAAAPDGFVLFARDPAMKTQYSTRYHVYRSTAETNAPGVFGNLSSMADTDDATVPAIYARILARHQDLSPEEMKPYTNTIPGTRVAYVMVPIPGGEFLMGSPETEPGRNPDEGPQHRVRISPFWMGRCEVTWNEFELFMYPDDERRMRETLSTDPEGDRLADAVTHPSKPYVEMSFGMGKDGFPAISMTQHAANKYCHWLSAKTGHFYRLPTEAEWEYAARAGTTTAYFFGDDPDRLGEYAWFEDNSDFKYQKVGRKKPNPWGLHDIYGNVVEWVLDQYDPDFYKSSAARAPVLDPWNKATQPYPHSVRGGSWDDDATKCRSAARRGSSRAWKMQDPQLPKSIWYHSDAQWVGFRIVRPLRLPSAEQMRNYWTSGVERD